MQALRNNMNNQDKENHIENLRNRDLQKRNCMNQDQRGQYLENMRNRVRQHRYNVNEGRPLRYYIGEMNIVCHHCQALRFSSEPLNCCHNGKVSLPPLNEYPAILRQLFDEENHEAVNFRKNIRNYNSAFALASFGANIRPPPGRGPYCFRLQGQIYHYATNLHPNGEDERKYGQLYIIETNEAIRARVNVNQNSNCLLPVFQQIFQVAYATWKWIDPKHTQ